MNLYGEISKVDPQDDGTIKVYGSASTGDEDSQGKTVLQGGIYPTLSQNINRILPHPQCCDATKCCARVQHFLGVPSLMSWRVLIGEGIFLSNVILAWILVNYWAMIVCQSSPRRVNLGAGADADQPMRISRCGSDESSDFYVPSLNTLRG